MAAATGVVDITLLLAIVAAVYIIGQSKAGQGAFRFRSGQLVRLLPPGRRQRFRTARLTRRIQCLDSRTVAFFVRMVVSLGHRHRLMAGEVVDLLDGDAEVEHSCCEGKGMAEDYLPIQALRYKVACQRRIPW